MAATSYKVIGEDLPGKITFAKEPEGSERRNFAALWGTCIAGTRDCMNAGSELAACLAHFRNSKQISEPGM